MVFSFWAGLAGLAGCGGGGHAAADGGPDGHGDGGADAGAPDGGSPADANAEASLVDVSSDRADTGAMARDGAGDGSTDGAAPCTPCNLRLGALIAGCSDGIDATGCIVETSQTANPDGTTINVVNQCYTEGDKLLTTKISGSVDAGAYVSSTSQRIKDGQPCMTQQTSGFRSAVGLVATDLFLDGAGHVVATVMTNAVAGADGGVVQVQTMTCAGQAAEPYRVCMPPAPAIDAGDAGGAGMVSCTPGACS